MLSQRIEFIRMPQLCAEIGLSRATVYRHIGEGLLKPVKLSKRAIGFERAAVEEYKERNLSKSVA